MNKTIEQLKAKLEANHKNCEEIKQVLKVEYFKVFTKDKALQHDIEAVQNSKEFRFDKYGEIASWVRLTFDLSTLQGEVLNFLEEYLNEDQYIMIDFKEEYLSYSQGPDCITIQDDTRNDNGVWMNNDIIIKESEYKDEDTNEVDEAKRNALIEKYMEDSGYFPGVFRVTQHGDVFLVNVKAKL